MSLAAAVALGLGLGARHALEPDHLAAVSTLLARDTGVARAARAAALWGLGHAAFVGIAGGVLVALGARVPVPVALALDAAVAAMLIGLGVSAFRARTRPTAGAAPKHTARPLLVGAVHGASGTAALTLLVATTIQDRMAALAFVAVFAIGSIAGMTATAALVAWPVASAARRRPRVLQVLCAVAGVWSIAAGAIVAWTTWHAS